MLDPLLGIGFVGKIGSVGCAAIVPGDPYEPAIADPEWAGLEVRS